MKRDKGRYLPFHVANAAEKFVSTAAMAEGLLTEGDIYELYSALYGVRK